MKYTGTVKDGVVVIEGDQRPVEGARVVVEEVAEESLPTLVERLGDLVGSLDLPEDFAAQHHHYIHGTPKR